MTKREFFNRIIADYATADADMVAQATHEIELLDRKSGYKSSKPTAKQIENEGIKGDILAYLGTVERATVTEIANGLGTGLSNQRVSALVTQLEGNGLINRNKEKRVSYISLA